jgi:hypothetical protein
MKTSSLFLLKQTFKKTSSFFNANFVNLLHLNQWNAVIAGKLFVRLVVRTKYVQMVAIARVSSKLAKFAKKF